MPLYKDLLHPSVDEEKRRCKLKRLVQSSNSYFMDVKCPGCYKITTVFSHAQTVVGVLDVPQCSVSQQVARHVSQKVAPLEESNTECIAVVYVRHILQQNALSHKLEVGERRSLASHYTREVCEAQRVW